MARVCNSRRSLILSIAALCAVLVDAPPLAAQNNNANNQNNNNQNGNNQNGNNQNGNNQNGNNAGQGGGIAIDASGVLRRRVLRDADPRLVRNRSLAAGRSVPGGASTLRKVSLPRLEKAVRARIDAGLGVTDEMRYLAGLTSVEWAFLYPESGDIVIAGPAEPWGEVMEGHMCGVYTGRPSLHLDDLVVALRTYARSSEVLVGCSIEPTQEGLARMQGFLRQIGSFATPAQTQAIVHGLKESLGPQNVIFWGVPADTHFAHVLVEADYRMKLIGIGLERPPVRLASFVSRANPATISRNALLRWWFVPDYECLRAAEDAMALSIEGDRVMLVGEDELVSGDGKRSGTGGQGRASKAFVTNFTEIYPQLAEAVPVYAQLRNLIDLCVTAAFMKEEHWFQKANWSMSTFGNESVFSVETLDAPRQVETAVTSMWKNNRLVTPIGGGVRIEPSKAVKSANRLPPNGKAQEMKSNIDFSHLAQGQWWWD